MKHWLGLALGLCLAAGAQAHEGHAPAAAPGAPVAEPVAADGTRDAQTYFTDTQLLTQDGQPVRFYSDVLKDRLVLLNVVFTHCTDACPLITRKLRDVRAALGEELASQVTFITLTSDPLNDTPAVLKAFTQKQGVESPNWLFLTGEQANVELVLARLGHLSASPEQHSTLLIVGDVKAKRWSKIRPDAPVAAIAERLQLLSMPVAGR
ncbi:SCO family protein [Pseudomonas sp. UL073]|uniref:SCO family protein n=1 Tax=Zestomonas insulae TaxID=2809017 RepID=A0ABS2I8D4_9GAMM|nr:SCO family protein [Pseudomonas insulae]MBM7059202.1 SCO family protein [Pseudomonas insulae]